MPSNSPKLDTAAAAEYCGLTKRFLDKIRCTGGGPAFLKLGRCIRYDTSDLDAWLAERRRASTSDPGPMAAA